MSKSGAKLSCSGNSVIPSLAAITLANSPSKNVLGMSASPEPKKGICDLLSDFHT